jgi:hypothetical protein
MLNSWNDQLFFFEGTGWRVTPSSVSGLHFRLPTKAGQITFWERRAPARHGIVKPITDYAELGLSASGINRPALFICPGLNW